MGQSFSCPHCQYVYDIEHHEKWELYEDSEDADIECPSCNKEFTVEKLVTWSFWPRKTDDQEDSENQTREKDD